MDVLLQLTSIQSKQYLTTHTIDDGKEYSEHFGCTCKLSLE